MTLGDAFNRRKKLGADLATWVGRLQAAGSVKRSFRTLAIDGGEPFVAFEGSEKKTTRHYTVDECRAKLAEIVAEDRALALRISLTNQRAVAEVEDIDGVARTYTVPELLVLKSDIIPKMEQAARAVPLRQDNVSVYETGPDFVKHRAVNKVERKKETFSEKGLKAEEMELVGFDVVETTDYGLPAREMYNEIDRVQEFLQRVKQAINRANKTELVA
ncbi:MAG: hypothetical protein KIT84_21060 [Labilithrix sp.]|nr:hypothetical protein [Labilithrix sp.]MCW5813533.1 hypothetical protein [Labilithrix sp.]